MKLFYYKDSRGVENFGDDLNRWLWPKLLHRPFNDDPAAHFVGIGTLLNGELPPSGRLHIFGSGVGYGRQPAQVDLRWRVHCVRGPRSAAALGLDPHAAVADPAIWLHQIYEPGAVKDHRCAYMPHYDEAIRAEHAWRDICDRLQIAWIDPRWSTEAVLEAISRSEVLLTEAMHGAIVADALRVPWAPVITSPKILPFKWQDWCEAMDLEFRPHVLRLIGLKLPLSHLPVNASLSRRLVHRLKVEQIVRQLDRVRRTARPVLSPDRTLHDRLAELNRRLDRFAQEWDQSALPTANLKG